MLTVERLRVLAELSRRRTLVAVADALSYSTSAVSQQLRQLEKDVGVPLVERVGRGLVLTAQGELLGVRAHMILAEVERAEADVLASAGHPRGTVPVAAFQSAALTLVPAAVRDLRERHPDVHVLFQLGETDEALAALPGAGVDLVIGERYPGEIPPPAAGLPVVPLLDDPLWLAVDADLARTLDPGRDLLAQLADAAWASEPVSTPPRTWLPEQCRRRGFAPRVTCVSEDLAVQAAFVASGHAVAVLPGLVLAASSLSAADPFTGTAPGTGSRHIRVFPLEEPAPSRQVVAAWRESAGRRARSWSRGSGSPADLVDRAPCLRSR